MLVFAQRLPTNPRQVKVAAAVVAVVDYRHGRCRRLHRLGYQRSFSAASARCPQTANTGALVRSE